MKTDNTLDQNTPVESTPTAVDPTPVTTTQDTPTDLTPDPHVDVLAKALHEAQVAELAQQAKDAGNELSFSFSTWDDLTEASRESRRTTARYLLARFTLTEK